MIRYSLTCTSDHSFESWFQSVDAFDRLMASGHVACTLCGSTEVAKTLMAPAVRPARRAAAEGATGPGPGHIPRNTPRNTLGNTPGDAAMPGPLAPQSAVEMALRALRRRIEATSDYVGLNFAAEARAIHEGAVPERSIYGEARPDEARRLIEDGIPVAPLPFVPGRKTN